MTSAAVKRELCACLCVSSLKQDLVPDAQSYSRVVPEVLGFWFLLHRLQAPPSCGSIMQIYLFLQDLLKLSGSSWMVSSPRTQGNLGQTGLSAASERNSSRCQSTERLEQALGKGEQHLSTPFLKAGSYTTNREFSLHSWHCTSLLS